MEGMYPSRCFFAVYMNMLGNQKGGKLAIGMNDIGIPRNKLIDIPVAYRRPHPDARINKGRDARKPVVIAVLEGFRAVRKRQNTNVIAAFFQFPCQYAQRYRNAVLFAGIDIVKK